MVMGSKNEDDLACWGTSLEKGTVVEADFQLKKQLCMPWNDEAGCWLGFSHHEDSQWRKHTIEILNHAV
jgi:hypothetical protein